MTAKAQDRRTTDEIAVLYSTSVAYGLGTGGWLATFTKPDTAAGGILPALGLAGASVAGVYALDHAGKPLRYGVGQSIVSGLYLGLGEGVAWSAWNQARVRHDEEWEASGVATMIWGMSTAGAVAGGVLGSVRGTTPGRASFVTSAGLWTGGIFGLLGGALTPDSDEEYRDDNALLMGAIALNAGAIAGVLAAGPVSPSIARVRFIDLGGAAGALLSGGLFWAAANDDVKPRALMGTLALGMTAGLGAGYWLTSGMEPDRTHAERPHAGGAHVELALAPLPGGASVSAMGQF